MTPRTAGRTDHLSRFFDSSLGERGNLPAVLERHEGGFRATSYASLNARLRTIAAYIMRVTSAEDRIAIYLPAGADAYAAELAAMFGGRLFCPLETANPIDRVLYCIEDFAPKLVLTDLAGEHMLAGRGLKLVNVETLQGNGEATSAYGQDAYVIYTSGSTGLPKGVKVFRHSVDRFLDWSLPFYGVSEGERWAQFSSLGFDLSLVDIFTCILSGGTLVAVGAGMDRMLPGRFIADFGIAVWHSVPSLIPMLVRESERAADQLRSLRLASFCGEPLFPQQVQWLLQAAPQLKVVNTYGPTEGTLFCTAQPVDAELCSATTSGSLPIGDPIPGWTFEYDEAAAEGELAELIIASDYLSAGYISATPDQARFGRSPTSGLPCYRTGDLVRRESGRVHYAQRMDNQVKVRGNRLDLTEVEYHALQFGAAEAKAFVIENSVFLAVTPPLGHTADELLAHLRAKLPTFSVPRDVLFRDELPRNANSKIDTRALKSEVEKKWKL